MKTCRNRVVTIVVFTMNINDENHRGEDQHHENRRINIAVVRIILIVQTMVLIMMMTMTISGIINKR